MTTAETELLMNGSNAIPMQNLWSYYEVETPPVTKLQDEIQEHLSTDWEREEHPHVSILPGFEVPDKCVEKTVDVMRAAKREHVGSEIPVTGVECFNEIHAVEPTFTVQLQLDLPLERIREGHTDVVRFFEGELQYEPVAPHVTLFKRGDGDESFELLSAGERSVLECGINELSVPDTIEVTALDVERY
jgi:2'-5' RNA ligase